MCVQLGQRLTEWLLPDDRCHGEPNPPASDLSAISGILYELGGGGGSDLVGWAPQPDGLSRTVVHHLADSVSPLEIT